MEGPGFSKGGPNVLFPVGTGDHFLVKGRIFV